MDEARLKMPDVALQRAFPSLSAGIFGRETTLAEKGSYLGLRDGDPGWDDVSGGRHRAHRVTGTRHLEYVCGTTRVKDSDV